MDKTAQTEWHRLFLVEGLPEPLTPASAHLQLFDNYIERTRLRIRGIRDPYTNTWTRILQQRFIAGEGDAAVTKLAEIHLNDEEYSLFEHLPTREIRKNRYFHEFDGATVIFDVYLGGLWGLSTAKVEFEDRDRMLEFEAQPFMIVEVTGNTCFAGHTLVDASFADVQAEVQRITVGRLIQNTSGP